MCALYHRGQGTCTAAAE
ncbi:hypothetical protein [Streptomyces sp. NPDC050534]